MAQVKTNQIEPQILQRFAVVKKIGSGAYGHVWKVLQKSTQKTFALKKIFDAFQHSTDAQRTFRQVEILQQIDHINIVKLFETIPAENNKDVYLLFEFMESDLHNAIGDNIMKDAHFKFVIYQIAKSLKYLHTGKIIHRDLKPANVLVNSNCKIKLCDFGLVRSLANIKDNGPVLTEGVATRWYRAPQVLLGSKRYSTPADVWSFGCIIYEMVQRKPLFPGSSTLDQLERMVQFTGLPSDSDIESLQSDMCKAMIKELKGNTGKGQPGGFMKGIPEDFKDLLMKMLTFNPQKRITVQDILKHPLVKPFRKEEEEIPSPKTLTTSIDDNRKVTVDEYRKLIYKGSISSSTKIEQKIIGSERHMHKQTSLINQDNLANGKQSAFDQALRRMKSCKNIYESMPGKKNVVKEPPIINQEDSEISWKELAKSPSEALRLSGKIIVRKLEVATNLKKEAKKDDEKTQIEASDLPNVADIGDTKFVPKKNFFSPKVTLSKKSISSFNEIFKSPANLKRGSETSMLFSPGNSPNKSPVRKMFSPFKKCIN